MVQGWRGFKLGDSSNRGVRRIDSAKDQVVTVTGEPYGSGMR